MKLYNGSLPHMVELVELFRFGFDDGVIKLVALNVFLFVLGILVFDVLAHQFINLGLQIKGNIDQFTAGSAEVGTGAFGLEVAEFVKVIAQLLDFGGTLSSLLVALLPDAVDIADLVGQEEIVAQARHQDFNIRVRPLQIITDPCLYFSFLLTKVVIELFDKLLAFFQTSYVALSSVVTLCLDHLSALEGADHFHLIACALDFGFVEFGGTLFDSHNGLVFFRFGRYAHLVQ